MGREGGCCMGLESGCCMGRQGGCCMGHGGCCMGLERGCCMGLEGQVLYGASRGVLYGACIAGLICFLGLTWTMDSMYPNLCKAHARPTQGTSEKLNHLRAPGNHFTRSRATSNGTGQRPGRHSTASTLRDRLEGCTYTATTEGGHGGTTVWPSSHCNPNPPNRGKFFNKSGQRIGG